ncbi:MAG: tetratricopeptide repeat protein [Bacteroidota bacterium]
MRGFIIFIFIFLLSYPIFCQDKADSLLILLKRAKEDQKPAIYNELASFYLTPATLIEAEDYAKKALNISKSYKNKVEEAAAYKNLGAVAYYKQDFDKALKSYELSLSIKEMLNDKPGAAALYYNIGILHRNNGNYDKAIENYESSLKIYYEINDTLEIASTYQVIGISYFYWSKYENAVDYYHKSLTIYEKINDENGVADCKQVLGVIYQEWGDYEKALKFGQDALRLYEKLDDKYRIGNTLMNIGILYKDWGNYNEKSLEYFNRTLEIMENIGNKQGVAYALTNIGSVYEEWTEYSKLEGNKEDDNYKKAIEYHEKALTIIEETGDKHGTAGTLQSIGNVYGKMKDYKKSLDFNQKALKIREDLGDKSGIAQSYHAIGTIYAELNDYSNALNYFNKSYDLAVELKKLKLIQDIHRSISSVYKNMGNYKNAYEQYLLYTVIKDSIINIESHKQIAEMEEKYEVDKKEQQIDHLNLKNELLNEQKQLQDDKIKQQNIILIISIIGLIIFIVSSMLLFRLFRQKKKANMLLAAKNQEISDSIHYASRIQSAILPPAEYMYEVLPEHFILDKPRDIVSGDFYWLAKKEDKLIVAVADCTGHGVPGAFMSMLGVAFLNEIVNQNEILQSNEILNRLRLNVIKSLHQTGKEGEATDGMDISLCVIDKANKKIQFSGANNPLYLVRNDELTELKADKMPISIHSRVDEPFSVNETEIFTNDVIYLFSDGFVDQFGGDNSKKFKFKSFKNLLTEIHSKPMNEQVIILDSTFNEWKGNLEQVDDILVMGIRIN